MKKSRIVLLALLLAVAAGIAYLWLSNPLNAVVKAAIEKFGSEMTQTKVSVGKVELSPTEGKGALSGLSVGAPKGFKADHAFRADHIELALEPASLAEDVILIHRIHIDSPDISYEKNDSGTNFDAIQRNVERYLGKNKAGKDGSRKMIIESLVIRNARVNYNGMLDLKLPDIELRNVGKKSGGATSAQVTRAIIAELNTQLAIALAKTAAISAVGGVAVGVGMGLKSLFEK